MDLDQCIERATRFLIACRDQKGWWFDFDLVGPSREWVSGYVGSCVAKAPYRDAESAARRAWMLLRNRRWLSGGWGYKPHIPADADSTVWALRLAQEIGEESTLRTRRARRFLLRHLRQDGGVATYHMSGALRRITQIKGIPFSGWCSSHTCVTAAAAHLHIIPERPMLISYLIRNQTRDGNWLSYWWEQPEYATALAVEALLSSNDASTKSLIAGAVNWAVRRLSVVPVSPFRAALLIRVLACDLAVTGARRAITRLVGQLIQSQFNDGSWQKSARLRVPRPDAQNPDSFSDWKEGRDGLPRIGSIYTDSRRVFTTATVLESLLQVNKRLTSKVSS